MTSSMGIMTPTFLGQIVTRQQIYHTVSDSSFAEKEKKATFVKIHVGDNVLWHIEPDTIGKQANQKHDFHRAAKWRDIAVEEFEADEADDADDSKYRYTVNGDDEDSSLRKRKRQRNTTQRNSVKIRGSRMGNKILRPHDLPSMIC
ncbi:hypothetical protein FB446DRAFT_700348 [Lentinula raphanica]|nr:hypothetical protein FB446DRAFT_700348 [Lentinula raphanica]